MLLTEVTVAFILKIDVVISLANILLDMINGILLNVNGNYIKVVKSLLIDVPNTFPSIFTNSNFKG